MDEAQASIPVINLSTDNDSRTGEKLVAAVIQWGFVYVRGDVGFNSRDIDSMFEVVGANLSVLPAPKHVDACDSPANFSIRLERKRRSVILVLM